MPKFVPGNRSRFLNGLAEIAINTERGLVTGLAVGATDAAIYGNISNVRNSAIVGAASGLSRTILNDIAFGLPKIYPISEGGSAIFRNGGVAKMGSMIFNAHKNGITLGDNIFLNIKDDEYDSGLYHETYHLSQIREMGVFSFYGKISLEMLRYGGKRYAKDGCLERAAMDYEKLFW